jgi:frataxin
MSLDDSSFETLAEQAMQAFADKIEEVASDEADVDLEGGILTVELEEGGTFLLNKHGPLKQLWLSSPVSGASHYAYDEASGRWRSTRDEGDLAERLAAELSRATGATITFG